MTAERDLFQEIEEEIQGSRQASAAMRPKLLGVMIGLLLVSILSAGWMIWKDTNPVSAVAGLVSRSTETPTPEPTSLPTPIPTTAPVPTAVPDAAVVDEGEAVVDGAADGGDTVSAESQTNEQPSSTEPTATPPPTNTAEPTAPPEPTATPTRAWSSLISAPVPAGQVMTGFTLAELNTQAFIQVSALMGYTEDALLGELDYLRAYSRGFIDDTLINADQLLVGAIPDSPLFLMVGQMSAPGDFAGGSGTLFVNVPWSSMQLRAQLTSPLLEQIENPSLVVNSWQVKGGWVWMLVSSPTLERAIESCRNSAPSINTGYFVAAGDWECDSQSALLQGGELEVIVQSLMGIEADGSGLVPLLPRPVNPIADRWVYADFGRYGTQLSLPGDVKGIVQESGMNFGLLQTSWDGNEFAPKMILQPTFNDGTYVYESLWSAPPDDTP